MKVNIKPLSVNVAWQGRRFKTDKYKAYEIELLLKLKKMEIPNGKLSLKVKFGHSNSLSDIDNSLKPFIDILQKKYSFNDRDIYHLEVLKEIVPVGKEFIKFKIESYD